VLLIPHCVSQTPAAHMLHDPRRSRECLRIGVPPAQRFGKRPKADPPVLLSANIIGRPIRRRDRRVRNRELCEAGFASCATWRRLTRDRSAHRDASDLATVHAALSPVRAGLTSRSHSDSQPSRLPRDSMGGIASGACERGFKSRVQEYSILGIFEVSEALRVVPALCSNRSAVLKS